MATTSGALMRRDGQVGTDIAGSVGSVLDAQGKLTAIKVKVTEDFRAEVIRIAKDTIASADPKTFQLDGFATTWKQQLDRFRERTVAVDTFQAELASVIVFFTTDNPAALIEALTARRDALQQELDRRNQGDVLIEQEITYINNFIVQLQTGGSAAETVGVWGVTPQSELHSEIARLQFEIAGLQAQVAQATTTGAVVAAREKTVTKARAAKKQAAQSKKPTARKAPRKGGKKSSQ